MASSVHTTFIGGSRYYADESTKVTLPGVTSVLNMFPKPFLQAWAAKMTAELAVDSVAFIASMEREGAINYLKDSAKRYTKLRGDIGSEAHDGFERLIKGQPIGNVPERAMPYIRQFDDFLRVAQPELIFAEDVMWSDTHGYAGSADAALTVRIDPEARRIDPAGGEPVNLAADWKTSAKTYPEVALQVGAYSNADFRIAADGTHLPMPEINGGAVLHVGEDFWSFKSLKITPDVFDIFLEALRFFNANRHWYELSKNVVGKPLAKSGQAFVSGTERRR